MPYINISTSLSDEIKNQILGLIDQIISLLPFLVNLTPEERGALYKMGEKSIPFVQKSLEYANSNPNLCPPYLDVPELIKDVNLHTQLTPIIKKLAQLMEMVDDTYTAVGSEAITAATTFYQSVKNASKLNVPGTDAIFSDLKTRFPGRPPKAAA